MGVGLWLLLSQGSPNRQLLTPFILSIAVEFDYDVDRRLPTGIAMHYYHFDASCIHCFVSRSNKLLLQTITLRRARIQRNRG
jgi:hypothetical protein